MSEERKLSGPGGPVQRCEEDRRLVERAKERLMERQSMTEAEAHRYLQKRSMDSGVRLVDVARLVLSEQ